MINLMQGDCLERMKEIPDGSVDLVLTDPPYGTTACKWDSVISLEAMWVQLKRVIKLNGAALLFGTEPFCSQLRISNLNMYKYDWIWSKQNKTGFMQAKTKPLNCYETIMVFGEFSTAAQYFKGVYNPQGVKNVGIVKYSNNRAEDHITGNRKEGRTEAGKGYPSQILDFKKDINNLHPTQKPVALMEYLIKTYTNEQETVLDFTMGSGTTGVACVNTNRKFIGIEKDEGYFKIAKERIESTVKTKE
jgi:DNA modification methylase